MAADDNGIDTDVLAAEADRLRADGTAVIFVGVDERLAEIIAIADPVNDTTPAALEAPREEGIEVVMLTGDNRVTAEAAARRLGIARAEAEVLPDHKGDIVTRLRADGRVVAIAGDGVNDAPALAAADVADRDGHRNRRGHRERRDHLWVTWKGIAAKATQEV